MKALPSLFLLVKKPKVALSVTAALALMLLNSSCALLGLGMAAAGATVQTAIALAPLKIAFACLPEGTMIDTPLGPQAIETLRAGDVVIGYDGEPVQVQQIHGYLEDPENSDFYEIGFSNGSKVDLCGMHRIGGERAQELKLGDRIKRGGPSVVSIRVYQGVERSYDILTGDKGYQVGSIPVNSMIEEMYEAGQTGNIKR